MAQCIVLVLNGVIESGNLDWAETILGGSRLALVRPQESLSHVERVEAALLRLAAAKTRDLLGGRDRLIDPPHRYTALAAQYRAWLAARGLARPTH